MHRLFKGFLVFALLAVLAFAAAPARAAWFFCHGATAVIQPSSLSYITSYDVAGWGLRVLVKKGKSVWIHTPLSNPALGGTYANEIQLIWRTDANNIYISNVDVYDGSIRFWLASGNWHGYTGSSAYKATNWKLGQNWKISRGFGMSFLVINKGSKDQEVTIASAGANFGGGPATKD